MGAELNKELGAEIELISSSGGVFEIVVDGNNIFSKKSLNRFPDDGEIMAALKK